MLERIHLHTEPLKSVKQPLYDSTKFIWSNMVNDKIAYDTVTPKILCVCATAYSHDDTELLES
jgi:hypothetical protein